jgi:hypothetical protein
MFCPKCGQEQVTEVPNFCSRCGFQLTEVTNLLARGGAPGETQKNKPPLEKVRRYGLRLLMAALAFLALAMFSAATEGDVGISIFGFLTFASFFIGSCLLISSWIKGGMRRRSESAPLGQQTSRVEAPQVGALSPDHAPPVALPRARFEPGALAQHPSVTEHTTRQLEPEPPQESERTH